MKKIELQAVIDAAVSTALAEQAVRIGLILRAPEAEGRAELALTLAINSTLSADAATAILRAAPKANQNGDRFLAAMAREGDLGIDSSGAQPSLDSKSKRKAELGEAAKAVRAARAS